MRTFLALFAAFLLVAPLARAADVIPLLIPHQGRLLDGSDAPVDGTKDLTFLIYDVEVDTPSAPVAPLWTGKYSVTVSHGLYTVDIGDSRGVLSTPLTSALFNSGKKLWLAVKVADDAELKPRFRLGAVPYAFLAGEALHANEADHAKTSDAVADGAVSTAKLATGAVTTDKLGAAAVTTDILADGAVTTAKIGEKQVTTALLADRAVTIAQLADLSVGTGQLVDKAVTAAQIADKTITAGQLADGAITGLQVSPLAIGTAQLAELSVTNGKLAAGSLTVNKFAQGQIGSASGQIAAGDHNHDAVYSKLGHTHPATDITGTLAYGQLPADLARTSNGMLLPAQRKVSALSVYSAGNNFSGSAAASATLDRVQITGASRGMNVFTIKRSDHTASALQAFDTFGDAASSAALATYLNGLGTDRYVVVTVLDEATTQLTVAAKTALKRCGAQRIDQLGYRDSYILVGVCGAPTLPVYEVSRPSSDDATTLGGPAEAELLLVDGLLAGSGLSKAGVFSPSKRQVTMTQSGAFKKWTNFDDLVFRSSGGPVELGVSMQLNDDIGISAGGEWISVGCRMRIDPNTPYTRVVDLALDQRWGAYNYQWNYHHTTVVPLLPGMHTAYLECELTRSAASNLQTYMGMRGYETGLGWSLNEPAASANSTYQDTLWAREL